MLSYEDICRKIISLEEAHSLREAEDRSKQSLVFTNGCFDLLHRGHIYYLSKARALGDILILGLNNDASVRRLKGPARPVNDERARAEVLAALAFVDYVILFGEDTPLNLIKSLRPDILVKGGDYKVEDIVGYKEVLSWQGRVETIPVLKGYSSSNIISKT